MSVCPEPPGWLGRGADVYIVPCKRWRCPVCGPRAARRFVGKLLRHVHSRYLITLTVAGDDWSLSRDTVMRLNRMWWKLARWLRRHVGLTNYAWVNELGSAHGRIHKHVLVECQYMDYKKIRRQIRRVGLGAPDFQPIKDSHGAARYCAKYLAKGCADDAWPRFARRCQLALRQRPAPHNEREENTFEEAWKFYKWPRDERTGLRLPLWMGVVRPPEQLSLDDLLRKSGHATHPLEPVPVSFSTIGPLQGPDVSNLGCPSG